MKALAAFVLHRWDWSESSLILDLFTRERGDRKTKIGVIGYGEGGLLALYAGAVDQRQNRSIDPLRFDFTGRAAGNAAHVLLEAVAALGNVGVVLDITRVHGFVRQFQMTVLKHVLQFLGGHGQRPVLFLRKLTCIPLHGGLG